MKTCSKCKEKKKISSFCIDKTKKGGRHTICKCCRKKYDAQPWRKNYKIDYNKKQTTKEQNKKWYKENKEEILQRQKEYYLNNQNLIKEKARKRRQNPEVKEYHKKYIKEYDKKPEAKEYKKQWKQNNPEKLRAQSARRIARKNNVPGEFSSNDIKQILLEQKRCCYYCGNNFIPTPKCKTGYHIEHKIPLSRTELNPTNGPENICLSCPSCNLHKWAKTEAEFKNGT